MLWFYISFATDTKFLGATVLQATDPQAALKVASMRGHNPGGEAAILLVPIDPASQPDLAICINHLVNEDEMLSYGGKKVKDLSNQLTDVLENHVTIVCEDYNK